MKAIVLAYHNIGCIGIEALLKNGYEIAAVFTHNDNPNENIWFNSVAELASSHGIPVFAPEDINHPLWIQKIIEIDPDILFSFYYRNMVASEILDIPSSGCLNLHGSFLPKYRGRCPLNWVLVNGETETGITLHYMTPRADDGDIVCQKKIAISDTDNAHTLHEKAAKTATDVLNEILPKLREGTVRRIPQDHSKASYFGARSAKDGEIDWNRDAVAIRNLVRAVSRPYPGAFSYLGNRKCIFWSVSVAQGNSQRPGTILSAAPLVIACGKGAIQVDFGQFEGGIFMSGLQLSEEMHLVAGMKFGKQ
jgi:UDP-4-amino-4-deoxy-L-arabinose formyltransferase/UDP-glucuronic acid dehydrogenase (UDP-4-keto-hexauronic acid decarboxylating)